MDIDLNQNCFHSTMCDLSVDSKKTMKYLSFLLLLPLIASSPVTNFENSIRNDISSNDVTLVTFDGAEGTTFKFEAHNDPVMGGVSVSTFEVNENENFGIFNGTVKIVPSLNAPGFCSMQADGEYNDASSSIGGSIVLRVRSSSPEYAGFRMVFVGNAVSPSYACRFGGTVPFTNGCYKALFDVPPGDEFVDISIPFTKFSDHWDPGSGNHITECSDDPKVCPTEKALGRITQIQIMGEGVAGDFHLEVESIFAKP